MVPQCSVHTKEDSETRPFDCLSCQDRSSSWQASDGSTKWDWNKCPALVLNALTSAGWSSIPDQGMQNPVLEALGDSASWMIDCTDSPLTPPCHEMRLFHFWRYPCSNREAKFLPFTLFLYKLLSSSEAIETAGCILIEFLFFWLQTMVFVFFYNRLSCHPFLRRMPTVNDFKLM